MSELLAKLSVRTMPLDFGGFGGKCELSAQDVAAALGMCQDKFAGIVFLRKNGVDLPEVSRLDELLAARQWDEWRERADAMVTAQLRLAEAQRMWGLRSMLRTRSAHTAIEEAQANMWPPLREEIYRQIRMAAVAEVCDPHTCRRCSGRGDFQAGELRVVCPACGGGGQKPRSFSAIARTCGVGRRAFSETWKPVFDWTHSLLRDALKIGSEEFGGAMR